MLTSRFIFALAAAGALVSAADAQNTPSRWGQGDEIGMANTLGSVTWQRCAQSLANPRSKSYEISHLRSNTMPQSPFGTPLRDKYRPTVGIPGTVHAFNELTHLIPAGERLLDPVHAAVRNALNIR